jgi:hypothetical protein
MDVLPRKFSIFSDYLLLRCARKIPAEKEKGALDTLAALACVDML